MRLYKLLPDGRRQIVGFALPGDFLGMTTSARHSFSADAIGARYRLPVLQSFLRAIYRG